MSKIITVSLPDIGEGVVEGEVIEWLKQVGDSLKQDEPVVVVMTDKATVELPAPTPGRLAKQYFKPGEKAILHKPLYDIETEGDEEEPKIIQKNEIKENKQVEKINVPVSKKQTSKRALATPPVRKLAKDIGVNLNSLDGSGKDGRITVEDIKTHLNAKNYDKSNFSHLPGDTEQPVIGIRNLMAKKMAISTHTAAHFSYFEEVDATRLIQIRENFKEAATGEGIQLTYMPFLIRALSLTLNKFPIVNGSFDQVTNQLTTHKQHNIGIAITTSSGLIVPVLKNVQDMNLTQIIRNFAELKSKALQSKLDAQDMKDSTITISNYGVLGGGGLWATPVINYPELAILAINKIQKQPFIRGESVVVRDVLNLSWSFDHRIIDGDLAASFSHFYATLIQNPAGLL